MKTWARLRLTAPCADGAQRYCQSASSTVASHQGGCLPDPPYLRGVAALLVTSLATGSGWAQTSADPARGSSLSEVRVVAPTEQPPATQVSEDVKTAPASVTVLEKKDLDRKTINTYGDILRGVTGVNVLEYHQGLIAYGITLRGFDSDHGRNIAVFLDGMPLNVTGSQHTNGYMDLAQLIPELVNRAELVRGPFSVYAGNHAVAGSLQFYTEAAVQSSIKVTVDNYGRTRVLPIKSFNAGPGQGLIALDLTKGRGYSDQSDIERINLFTRYQMPLGDGLASARLQIYDAKAEAPGYLDRDAILAGKVGLRDFLVRGIGDAKSQQNLVLNYRSNDADGTGGFGTGWFTSIYLNNDTRKRWVNYDLNTPVRRDDTLTQERDRLQQLGFDLRKTSTFKTVGLPSQFTGGIQYNREQLNGRRFLTNSDHDELQPSAAMPDTRIADRKIVTTTKAVYGQYQIQPVQRLKVTAGLRYDRISFDTKLRPDDDTYAAALAATGTAGAQQSFGTFSPKLGAAVALLEPGKGYRAEVFANAARGFKSPYAFSDLYANVGGGRGVIDLSLSPVRSYEVGVQGGAADNSHRWRASVWDTRQSREADVNNAGIYQSFKSTKRSGFDLEGDVLVRKATRVFANYSHVNAHTLEPVTPGFDRIPNAPDYVGTLGVASVFSFGANRFDLSLADSLIGPQNVTTDGAVRTHNYHRAVARVAYTRPEWNKAVVFLNLVGYSRQLDELVFDFGGGQFGTNVAPRLRATLGLQVPF